MRCLAFHPDGKTLMTGGNQDVMVRDVPGKRPPMAMGLAGHGSGVRDGAWRGRRVTGHRRGNRRRRAALGPDATPLRGKAIRVAPPGSHGHCAFALSPEGRYLAVSHPNGTIYVLRLAPPGQVYRLP